MKSDEFVYIFPQDFQSHLSGKKTLACFDFSLVQKYPKNEKNIIQIWVMATHIFFLMFTPKIGVQEIPNLTCAYFSDSVGKTHQLEIISPF